VIDFQKRKKEKKKKSNKKINIVDLVIANRINGNKLKTKEVLRHSSAEAGNFAMAGR
jgi:hypothetical protein